MTRGGFRPRAVPMVLISSMNWSVCISLQGVSEIWEEETKRVSSLLGRGSGTMVGSTVSWFRSRGFNPTCSISSSLGGSLVWSQLCQYIRKRISGFKDSGRSLAVDHKPPIPQQRIELLSLLLHNLEWPYFKTLCQLSFHVPWLMAKLGFFHTASGNWTCVGSVAPPGVTWTQYALPTEQPKPHHRRKRCTRKRQPQQVINLKA